MVKSFPIFLISDQQRSGREEKRYCGPKRGQEERKRAEKEKHQLESTLQEQLHACLGRLSPWGKDQQRLDHVSAEGARWSGDDWSQHNASCVSGNWGRYFLKKTSHLCVVHKRFAVTIWTHVNMNSFSNDRREKPKDKPAGGLSLLNPSYLALGKADR